jgi:hypothetical protein
VGVGDAPDLVGIHLSCTGDAVDRPGDPKGASVADAGGTGTEDVRASVGGGGLNFSGDERVDGRSRTGTLLLEEVDAEAIVVLGASC